jgi:hypothetical protein
MVDVNTFLEMVIVVPLIVLGVVWFFKRKDSPSDAGHQNGAK